VPTLTAGPDGRPTAVRTGPTFAGSGLAGLAERVRILGGELSAGTTEPQGFSLRVVVPLSPAGVSASAHEPRPAGGTMGG